MPFEWFCKLQFLAILPHRSLWPVWIHLIVLNNSWLTFRRRKKQLLHWFFVGSGFGKNNYWNDDVNTIEQIASVNFGVSSKQSCHWVQQASFHWAFDNLKQHLKCIFKITSRRDFCTMSTCAMTANYNIWLLPWLSSLLAQCNSLLHIRTHMQFRSRDLMHDFLATTNVLNAIKCEYCMILR